MRRRRAGDHRLPQRLIGIGRVVDVKFLLLTDVAIDRAGRDAGRVGTGQRYRVAVDQNLILRVAFWAPATVKPVCTGVGPRTQDDPVRFDVLLMSSAELGVVPM